MSLEQVAVDVGEPRQVLVERRRAFVLRRIEPSNSCAGHPLDAIAEEFLERYTRHWKPSTLRDSAYIGRTRILPAFGHLTVDAIRAEAGLRTMSKRRRGSVRLFCARC